MKARAEAIYVCDYVVTDVRMAGDGDLSAKVRRELVDQCMMSPGQPMLTSGVLLAIVSTTIQQQSAGQWEAWGGGQIIRFDGYISPPQTILNQDI